MFPGRLQKRLRLAFQAATGGAGASLAGARELLRSVRPGPRASWSLPARGPYVQDVSSGSAVVVWVGDEPGPGRVEYGETPGLGREAFDGDPGRRHAVMLSGLEPGKEYHYRVDGVGGAPVAGRLRTAPAVGDEGARFAFAVIGDSGDGGPDQLAVARLLKGLSPDLILHTGDVVYPAGEDRDYDERFFGPYGETLREVPVFPTLGNHDVDGAGGAAYLANFRTPRDDPGGLPIPGAGRYYSFDWGGVHFVSLDSELYYEDTGGSLAGQRAWLEADLAATARPWKVVFLHRPPYSSSDHGSDLGIRADLEPVFVRHGVDLVFSGHDHAYERTVAMDGVTYVVSGGGGKMLYPVRGERWTAAGRSCHHAVLVSVEGAGRLRLEAVGTDGAVFDRLDLAREERGSLRRASEGG